MRAGGGPTRNSLSWLGLRLLVWLCLLGAVFASFERQIKIVEGVDHPSIGVVDSSQSIPPYPPLGPACLSFVLGSCFTLAKADRFEYTVCPFHNVTMKRSSISSSSVLLGLWGGVSWQLPDAHVQEYSAGHYCRGPTLYSTLVRYMCFTADGKHIDFDPLSTTSTYSPASGGTPENQPLPLLPLSLVGFDAVEHGDIAECSFVATIATAFPCSLLATGVTRSPPTTTPTLFPQPRSGESRAGSNAGAGSGAGAVAEAGTSSVTARQLERLEHQIAVLKAQLAACQRPE